MRILIITQIFTPEMGAQANRLQPMVRHLVKAGHDVFVATGMPNYPSGVVADAYRGVRFVRETVDGATVLRSAYFTTPRNKSKWAQLRSYLSFVPAAFHSGLKAGPIDIVFVTSPPIFPAVAAMLLAKIRRSKLIFDVRDLWPDEIMACGAAREGSMGVLLIRLIERIVYKSADRICCTTRAFMELVAQRGANMSKIVFLPNGADLSIFNSPVDDGAEYRRANNQLVVMYSGLIGIKHGLETIMDVAGLLKNDPSIKFIIVGTGPRAEAIQQLAADRCLTNVQFAGGRPVTEIPSLLAQSDICVTCLLTEPYLRNIVPAKIYEYMAAGKPIVAGVAGEADRIIHDAQAGIVTLPGDAAEMAQAILTLRDHPDLREQLGRNGRLYVEENYSREKTAAQLGLIVDELCPPQAPHQLKRRLAA